MQLKLVAGAVALGLGSSLASALELSLTPAVTSDYDFRGISQSARDPAIQLSFDVATNSGWGFYIWGSQIDFGPGSDTDTEIDYSLFYGGGSDETAKWEVGAVYYTYLSESDFNYPEFYVGIAKPLSDKFSLEGKLWFSNDYVAADENAFYAEANASYSLPNNWALNFHVGHSWGDYWDAANDGGYTDFALGIGYTYKNFTFDLKYVDTTDLPDPGGDVFATESKVVLTVSASFPIYER
ncbi:MAG: TorF family putative porin [Steroidobacteraceae bacterium]|nr:TorF family putative porin [Steroidobacteraceae bacterium]MDW8260854.1 TorF family putative porin [Gammaproteobacteria bacterium]